MPPSRPEMQPTMVTDLFFKMCVCVCLCVFSFTSSTWCIWFLEWIHFGGIYTVLLAHVGSISMTARARGDDLDIWARAMACRQ